MFDKICLYLINFNKKNTQKPFSKSQFKAWAPYKRKMVPRNSTKRLIQKHTFSRDFLKYIMGPGKHEVTAP